MKYVLEPIKFTVISASNNNVDGVRKLYTSLQSQSYNNWEWIVHDNASEDGTVEFLSNLSDDRLQFSSFKDDGIYQAFNICLERATGHKVIFLGVDDFLFDERVFDNVVRSVNFRDKDFVYGALINYSEENDRYIAVNDFSPVHFNDYPGHAFPPLPSLFVDASVFKQYRFDENNFAHSDLLFFYENLNDYDALTRLNVIVSCMGDRGVTSDKKSRSKRIREKYKIFLEVSSNKNIQAIFGYFPIYTRLKIRLRYWLI
tara:strand:- start:7010 stop:7783 length:774 start_codon:yes stop_codon:yes gene_type:complete